MPFQIPKISDIPEAERTALVLLLLEALAQLKEEHQLLKDEIARLKGQKTRPNIEPPSRTVQKNPVLLRRQVIGISFQFKG